LRLACVARLDPAAKGQDILFRVLALDKWRARNVQVTLFGRGKSEETLKQLATHLDLRNVTFAGHVDDIATVWHSHDALVLPRGSRERPSHSARPCSVEDRPS
jgi:glycosyltransferase involved in cell wall biosynthesis